MDKSSNNILITMELEYILGVGRLLGVTLRSFLVIDGLGQFWAESLLVNICFVSQ